MKLKVDTASVLILASLFGGLLIFSYGFFPLSHSSKEKATRFDLPTFVGDFELDHSTYKPYYQRTILMIIDAMRIDFVEDGQMPHLGRLIERNESCLVHLKVHPPTVTMPRLKALTSGTIPNFIDLVLNLGGTEMNVDNLLAQIRSKDSKIVFYGDSTWVKLFPNTFSRKGENVDSLFVNDFYEGDKNITQRLAAELIDPDWQLMVLHYLGLDHIGHVEGPFGPKMPGKLEEMDRVVSKIVAAMVQWNVKSELPALYILTGDHGMRDTGGHGGSSPNELYVPLIVTGPSCVPTENIYNQIDVTTTVSILLGLPIPHSAIGIIIPELIEDLPEENQLFAFNYNSERLLQMVRKQFTFEALDSMEFFVQHQEAVESHRLFLFSHGKDKAQYKRAKMMYISSSQEMSNMLTQTFLKYDLFAIALGILIVSGSTLILVLKGVATVDPANGAVLDVDMNLRESVIILIISMLAKHIVCKLFEIQSPLFSFSIPMNLTFLALVTNAIYFAKLVKCCVPKWDARRFLAKWSNMDIFLGGIIGCQLLALTATSFIEEEHQLWYYFSNTLFVVLFVKCVRPHLWHKDEFIILKLMASKRIHREVKEGGEIYIKLEKCHDLIVGFLSVVISHLIVRRLNQTGDKWLHVRDIGDFLAEDANKFYLSLTMIASLMLVLYSISSMCGTLTNILTFTALILAYFYRTATGQVALANNIFDSTSTLIILFWLNLTEIILIECIPALYRGIAKGTFYKFDCRQLIGSSITIFCLLASILHKPHNVILNGVCVWTCRWIKCRIVDIWPERPAQMKYIILTHFFLGKLFFFYQGNSNSLASIDLTAGYIGLSTFNPIVVGIFLTANTFNGQILTFLLMLYHVHELIGHLPVAEFKVQCHMVTIKVIETLALLISGPMCLYLFVVTILRHHLFVWTVLSPKLIYELYTFLLYFLLLLIYFGLSRIMRALKMTAT